MSRSRTGKRGRARKPNPIRRPRPSAAAADGQGEVFLHFEFEITDEPILDQKLKRLSPQDRETIEEIAHTLHAHGASHVNALEGLRERYPQLQMLYNYLEIAYRQCERYSDADQLVREMYRKFPDYVFAIAGYVRLMIGEDDLDEAERALKNRFVIGARYPNRSVFHISEFVSYTVAAGLYLLERGRFEDARRLYLMFEELDFDHPGIQYFEQRLLLSTLKQIVSD